MIAIPTHRFIYPLLIDKFNKHKCISTTIYDVLYFNIVPKICNITNTYETIVND